MGAENGAPAGNGPQPILEAKRKKRRGRVPSVDELLEGPKNFIFNYCFWTTHGSIYRAFLIYKKTLKTMY